MCNKLHIYKYTKKIIAFLQINQFEYNKTFGSSDDIGLMVGTNLSYPTCPVDMPTWYGMQLLEDNKHTLPITGLVYTSGQGQRPEREKADRHVLEIILT